MRRAIAIIALLQLVYFASGVTLVRAGASCCCVKKSGAGCPLRAHCSAGGRACALDSGASTAAKEPTIRAVVDAAFRLAPRRDVRDSVDIAPGSVAAHVIPPEIPPPRTA